MGFNPDIPRQIGLDEDFTMLLSVERMVGNCRRVAVEEFVAVAPSGESAHCSRRQLLSRTFAEHIPLPCLHSYSVHVHLLRFRFVVFVYTRW